MSIKFEDAATYLSTSGTLLDRVTEGGIRGEITCKVIGFAIRNIFFPFLLSKCIIVFQYPNTYFIVRNQGWFKGLVYKTFYGDNHILEEVIKYYTVVPNIVIIDKIKDLPQSPLPPH